MRTSESFSNTVFMRPGSFTNRASRNHDGGISVRIDAEGRIAIPPIMLMELGIEEGQQVEIKLVGASRKVLFVAPK